ncbi:glycosyltransferase [Acetivibrio sp. MSJd-27]|uniref:glycosyltransferase family A protein n=1 Tax=Acetivibrio sp. MSJd-27 TaxID=2841523 RepID=UPI001C11A04B|nr:glycosyltransferase [Acetivibrio sp. MSJd-27]MBU5450131.1 glycosyltransferase family 2 protein [Acetivibrio sp. MSJd-27]
MKLQVLVATMHQKDFSKYNEMNIQSDVLFINQCEKDCVISEVIDGHQAKMIYTTQRGLSKSRNMALSFAEGDICLIADDDVRYIQNYEEKIVQIFKRHPQADVIVFNVNTEKQARIYGKTFLKIRKSPRFKNYTSVRIAFRKNRVIKSNTWFPLFFGSGSLFSAGEEALFLRELKRKGLIVYEHPLTIGDLLESDSQWFTGYDEKFFYDKGAWVKCAFPRFAFVLKFYYIIRLFKKTSLPFQKMNSMLNAGIKGFCELKGYQEFCDEQ